MTLFQCRRFQFFDLQKVDLDVSLTENLKGCEVTCGTSGRGEIFVGDSEGSIHYICRKLKALTVAVAHEKCIYQIHQLRQSPYVFTMGEDKDGFSIKVWDESIKDTESSRPQLLWKRTLKLTRPKPPSCFAIHENLTILAVGYADGYLQLYRGEITRDRNIKPRALLIEGEHGDVTGISFKSGESSIILFVSTLNAVFSFDVTSKDREAKLLGDKSGCIANCSCYSEGSLEEHFIVGRNDAVYCYTRDSRGPCYGFDGEKQMLYYFRGYLLIIARVNVDSYSITVFDSANKFVGFSTSLMSPKPIRVATSEWGCLFIMSSDGTLWQLKEKDLQSKMAIFYKKHHYDLAIKVAKNNNFDAHGMSEIFRQYGDYLYSKGDLDGAIRQYCKTVGKLEPSYVVRKYLDSSRVLNLLEYLEVVHKTRHATPDLTTLLLNCLTKLKLNDKVEHYVKDPSCDFLEPETAIKVFRKGGMYKQAFLLAQKHHLYGSAFQILIEDVKDPSKDDLYDILEKTIQDDNVEMILKNFGSSLVQLVSKTDSKSIDGWKRIVRLLCECPVKRDLVDLFVAKKDILLPLLENICQEFQSSDGPLMNLLLEAYLDQWTINKDGDIATREKILALLSKAPDCPSWDWARALFTCKMFGFSTGEIIAYEKLGLHNDLLSIRYTAAMRNPALWTHFIETCRKYAKQKPSLWKDSLYLITTSNEELENEKLSHQAECPQVIVEEILAKVVEENLMEPLPILDRLCQTNLKLGSVRKFLSTVLNRSEIEENETTSNRLVDETFTIRDRIGTLRSKPSVFQSIRCSVCSQLLEFPSVHFLCLHSFHQHCIDSYAVNDKDCPVCWNKDKDTLGLGVENKTSKVAMDADFAMKLSTAKSNSFSVLADFVSKGIFHDNSTPPNPALAPKKSIEKLRFSQALTIDPIMHTTTSEGRLRLQEGTVNAYLQHETRRGPDNSSIESYLESVRPYQRVVPPNQTVQPSRSGAFNDRTLPSTLTEHSQIKRSQNATIVNKPTSSLISQNITKSLPSATVKQSTPKNPFEEDDDDDVDNPFKEPAKPKNPFDEDDYDPSLNPFAE